MKIQKRDLVAVLLSYIILRLTVLDDSFDSNMKSSINLSFYTEYTSSPLCILDRKKDSLKNHPSHSCQPIQTARPLILMEEHLMVVPRLSHDSNDNQDNTLSQQKSIHKDIQNTSDKDNKIVVPLHIVDISPWEDMKHDDPLTFPFHAKSIGQFASPKSNDSDNSIHKAPIKLVASPLYTTTLSSSAEATTTTTTTTSHNNQRIYRQILSIWNDGTIVLYELPPPSDIESDIQYIWKDDHTIPSILSESNNSKGLIQEVDAIFYTPKKGQTKHHDGNETIHAVVIHIKFHNKDNPGYNHDFILSMESNTGSILWMHANHPPKQHNPSSHNETNNHDTMTDSSLDISYDSSKDCFQSFRSSLMDPSNHVFPHAFWNTRDDSLLHLANFHRRPPNTQKSKLSPPHTNHHTSHHPNDNDVPKTSIVAGNKNRFSSTSSKHQQQHQQQKRTIKTHAIHNTPNVVISHGSHGIKVYSLQNGHEVCHVSLFDVGHAYADINHDGILDQIHVPAIGGHSHGDNDMEDESNHHHDKEISFFHPSLTKLFQQAHVNRTAINVAEKLDPSKQKHRHHHNCRIVVFNGIPAVEELFQSSSLCSEDVTTAFTTSTTTTVTTSTAKSKKAKTMSGSGSSTYYGTSYSSAPPLIVPNEHFNNDVSNDGGGMNMFLAFHHGEIMKYQSSLHHNPHHHQQKALLWTSSHKKSIPKWNPTPQGQSVSLVALLPSSFHKAILVCGEEGMSILSDRSGSVLSSIAFPQTSSMGRPLLIHVGDYNKHHLLHSSRSASASTSVDHGKFHKNAQKDLVFVFSKDGIWGYTISVEKTMDIWCFIAVFVLMVLGLLVLWKAYKDTNHHPSRSKDKRCMDWHF